MIEAVLFDLDGTLIDTNELIIQSFLHTLDGVSSQSSQHVTRAQIIEQMGLPLAEQLQMFTGLDEVEELIVKYRRYNVDMHDELVEEFPNVYDVLKDMQAQGIRMGIVTNKVRNTTEMGLRLCRLDKLMECVVTVDDVKKGKPDPEAVRLALHKLQVAPEKAVMIGDSHYDILTAKAAGVQSIGVGWSLKGADYLQTFQPDAMIGDIRELPDILKAMRDRV
ncbi:MAG: pyrophosphatase [Paenibacillus sp. RIFOXYA1_FULL_44_5]|nr:MAG: pyrophosphatase [Paenibacillus sp. RIFOXYA1_FULL_44_5]